MRKNAFSFHRRRFSTLSEKEILALAISSEEDDERIYLSYAEHLQQKFPKTAQIFEKMAEEERNHRNQLIALFRERFGERIPLIRREHVQGFYHRKPDWLGKNLPLEKIRAQTILMEEQSARFYYEAAQKVQDAGIRKLLGDLASEEKYHKKQALVLEEQHAASGEKDAEKEHARRRTLLTWIQPGLAGLMDGSVSTLAPIFAAAFATCNTRETFLVGLSASIGAGISMGFTEAVHDDGKLTGRGSPIKRGIACGLMTAIGGLGHTLPYLMHNFRLATLVAFLLVFVELWAIVWIQNKFMDTPFWRATLQVVLGGAIVFATGIFIGMS